MDLAEIERAKVSEERLIHQVVINAEVEGVLPTLGWRLVTDPVEALGDDLDGLVLVGARVAGGAVAAPLDRRLART